MNLDESKSLPPRFFNLIGWSWLIFGLIGILMGLLSLPALFRLDDFKAMLGQTPLVILPSVLGLVNQMVDMTVPLTLGNLAVSVLITAASWYFLKGRNWARLTLSLLNAVGIIAIVVGFYMFWYFYSTVSNAMGIPQLAEQGLINDYSGMMLLILIGGGTVMVLPLLWIGWYFHSPPVRQFFKDAPAINAPTS